MQALYLFIHHWWTLWFYTLVIVTMLQWPWTCKCLLEILTSLPSDIHPEIGFLDHMVLLFLRNLHTAFLNGYTSLHHRQCKRVSVTFWPYGKMSSLDKRPFRSFDHFLIRLFVVVVVVVWLLHQGNWQTHIIYDIYMILTPYQIDGLQISSLIPKVAFPFCRWFP